ncbi:hypothetical protein E2C01_087624 [Portunus trituberculatus]|uniref:Uncharacterized protein n=1 Tax=Portunus trituberculatus TaxID=210409 RepID=A0A5B7J8N0_PORTR|nr:hypothetical protein [Portunus trituberculatus]
MAFSHTPPLVPISCVATSGHTKDLEAAYAYLFDAQYPESMRPRPTMHQPLDRGSTRATQVRAE